MVKPIDLLHDGKAIKIYSTALADEIIIDFTDEITAYDKTKRAKIYNKGLYCCSISSMIFDYLNKAGVKTHFIKQLSETQMHCLRTKSIPLEIVVRNVIAGSLAENLDVEVGHIPTQPIFDICYKSDHLRGLLVNDYQLLALEILSKEALDKIYELSQKVNELLIPLFEKADILLVDYKLEFAYLPNGELAVRDYISPDNARFWDKGTRESLDKDRFKQDKGNVSKAYNLVYERLKKVI